MAGKVWVRFAFFLCYIIVLDCALSNVSEPLSSAETEREEAVDQISSPVDGKANETLMDSMDTSLNELSFADANQTISVVNVTETVTNNSELEISKENETKDDAVVNSTGLPKWFCKGLNDSQSNTSIYNRVVIVDSDELLRKINSSNDNESDSCAIVLFYTNYCPFSAKLAPLYNALGRVYGNLPVLAIDAHKQHSLNTRFGIVAVPTILLFHSGKPVLKFNYSVTLDDLRDFVKNNTGVEGNYSIQVSEVDYLGPLQSKPVEERDYYLLFSVLFLLTFGVIMFSKSSYRHLAWEKIQAVQWRRIFRWCSREKQD